MNITEKKINPAFVCKVGSLEFEALVSSVADHIKDSGRLWSAYLDFCQATKGCTPDEYLPQYAAYQVETSCADTSTDIDSDGNKETFGTFNLADALFAARVNLLGCPHITNYLKTRLDPYHIRTHFYVEEGRLNATVEIVGRKEAIYKHRHLRRIRDILRCYGFGDIETLEENTTDEPHGAVSIPTLASRTLPY